MGDRPNILLEDVEAALQQVRGIVDITPEDLLKIVALTLNEVEKRKGKFQSKEWIKEIMKAPVITCTPDTTIPEAVRILLEQNLHCLPVIDAGGKLVGIVTETDLMLQFSPETLKASLKDLFLRKKVRGAGQKIGDVMVKKVVSANPEDPINKVIHLMLKYGYGRIPVVNKDNVLIGIVARKDVLGFLK